MTSYPSLSVLAAGGGGVGEGVNPVFDPAPAFFSVRPRAADFMMLVTVSSFCFFGVIITPPPHPYTSGFVLCSYACQNND